MDFCNGVVSTKLLSRCGFLADDSELNFMQLFLSLVDFCNAVVSEKLDHLGKIKKRFTYIKRKPFSFQIEPLWFEKR